MKYQIITREEIEANWDYEDELSEGQEFILYEDGTVYVHGESDGHIIFDDCVFPDPSSNAKIMRISLN